MAKTIICLAILALFGVGCASKKVNWQSRVGNYTYDQAVAELGPPDKQTVLSDGNKVAEWITDRGSRGGVGIGFGTGSYGYRSGVSTGVGIGQTIGGSSYERFLRLTFLPDGKLLSWQKDSR